MSKYALILLIALIGIFPGTASAEGFLGTSEGIGIIAQFISNVGTAVGLVLFFHGLYSFYSRGENPQRFPVSYCLSTLLAGTFLLISSTVYAWSVNSVSPVAWATDSSMLAIGSNVNEDATAIQNSFLGRYIPQQSFTTLMGFIYIAGLIGFIRGLYLFKNVGQMDNQQEGGFSKASWHVAGGCALMNIILVSCFIGWLSGIPYLCLE